MVETTEQDFSSLFRKGTVAAFTTPIVTYPLSDTDGLNADLRALILEKEKSSPGIVKSNVGGWHSELGIFGWDADCIKALYEQVRLGCVEMTRNIVTRSNKRFRADYRIDGWANVMRSGNYHNSHNHPNNLWSGVYYVSAGEPEPEPPRNGCLEFQDPRTGANMVTVPDSIFELRYSVTPKEGVLVLFPSWLRHHVHPFIGTGERITVAVNALISGFQYIDDETDGAG